MKNEIVMPWLDYGVKYGVMLYGTYYLFIRCVSEKPDKKKLAEAAAFSVALGFFFVFLASILNPMHMMLMLLYLILTNCLIYRNELNDREGDGRKLKLRDIVILSLLCFAFCEALFMLVGFVSSVVLSLTYYNIMPPDKHSVWDFLNDIPVHTAAYTVMISLVWATEYLAARMRRLRRGLMNIVEHRKAGVVIMFAMLMLMVLMMFGSVGVGDDYRLFREILFVPAIAFCVVMIVWIRREIRADFVGEIRQSNLRLFEGGIAGKDREIADLAEDNEKLSGVIRRDAELMRCLTEECRRSAAPAETEAAAETIEQLYSGRCEAVGAMESYGASFGTTGINAVDAILNYMACKARDKDVDFAVKVDPDMGDLIGRDIGRREFNTILADLTENAIISAGVVKDRRVEVMLLRNRDHLCLEVLDSGERFDVGVLKNMGKKRITTHPREGGSGIGLMTLFRIINKTGASFTIEEFSRPESHDRYAKALSVEFNGARRFRIVTDRSDELKQALRSDRFEVVGE